MAELALSVTHGAPILPSRSETSFSTPENQETSHGRKPSSPPGSLGSKFLVATHLQPCKPLRGLMPGGDFATRNVSPEPKKNHCRRRDSCRLCACVFCWVSSNTFKEGGCLGPCDKGGGDLKFLEWRRGWDSVVWLTTLDNKAKSDSPTFSVPLGWEYQNRRPLASNVTATTWNLWGAHSGSGSLGLVLDPAQNLSGSFSTQSITIFRVSLQLELRRRQSHHQCR